MPTQILGCKQYHVSSPDPDPLTREEIETAPQHCVHPSDANLFTVAVYAGLRTAELAALAWEDVDFESRRVTIRRAVTINGFKLPKTGKPRYVDLLEPAYLALRQQRQYTQLQPAIKIATQLQEHRRTRPESIRPVFSPQTVKPCARNGAYFSVRSLHSKWKRLLSRAQGRYRTVYPCRHTYACWMLSAYGKPAYIAQQLGHTNFQMLARVYGQWMDSYSAEESARVWEALKACGH